MTRTEFDAALDELRRESDDIVSIARAYRYPEDVTFAARCVMLERTAEWFRRLSRLQLASGVEIPVSGEMRTMMPIVPPTVRKSVALVNWDKAHPDAPKADDWLSKAHPEEENAA